MARRIAPRQRARDLRNEAFKPPALESSHATWCHCSQCVITDYRYRYHHSQQQQQQQQQHRQRCYIQTAMPQPPPTKQQPLPKASIGRCCRVVLRRGCKRRKCSSKSSSKQAKKKAKGCESTHGESQKRLFITENRFGKVSYPLQVKNRQKRGRTVENTRNGGSSRKTWRHISSTCQK